MTAATTADQAWFMPRGLMVSLRQQGVDWSRLVVLAHIALRSSGLWDVVHERPHRRDDKYCWQNQSKIGEQAGLSASAISKAARELEGYAFNGRPVLRSTRKGSVFGVKAYGVLWVSSRSKTARHIHRSMITSAAFTGLSQSAAGLYLCLRDDFGLAAESGWLDCTIRGLDGNSIGLMRRYGCKSPSVITAGLRELEQAGFIRKRVRQHCGRDVGISIQVLEVPPEKLGDAEGPPRRRDDLLRRVGMAIEAMVGNGELTWAALRKLDTASALKAFALEIQRHLPRRDGARVNFRAVYQRCKTLRRRGWGAQAQAAAELDQAEIIRDELVEAAADFSPEEEPFAPSARIFDHRQDAPEDPLGEADLLTRWNVASVAKLDDKLWKRVLARVRRAKDRREPDALGNFVSELDYQSFRKETWARVEVCPDDGRGPILWVCHEGWNGRRCRIKHFPWAWAASFREATRMRVGFATHGRPPP